MTISNIKAIFNCDVKIVFNIVTDLKNYSWRSDLSKIEILDSTNQFIEYTKDGYPTTFTITKRIPYQRYEFDIHNDNITGHWTGIFTYENGITTIDFTENITAKKFYMKPFIKVYLKKQQTTYINDLDQIINQEKNN